MQNFESTDNPTLARAHMSICFMALKKHEVPEKLLASLLANHKNPEHLIGENGFVKQFPSLLLGKALDADLTERLSHDRHETEANAGDKMRSGKDRKTIRDEF